MKSNWFFFRRWESKLLTECRLKVIVEKPFDSVEREMAEYSSREGDMRCCQGKFAKIRGRICYSEEILASSGAVDGLYYFQRWFLSLRSKVLEIITL